jgi:hypothetical protein
VFLPLANGRLVQLGLTGSTSGPEWRSPFVDKNAEGYLVAVSSKKLASTDGGKGLALWQFDGENVARIATAEVKSRIISAPGLVRMRGQSALFALCVADLSRTVTLFQGDTLAKVREWTMSDTITAGPFVRGNLIGVVVSGRRLVWLDPDTDERRWAHTFPADIVGEPQIIDGHWIVADESGKILALDPILRQTVGLGYDLHAAVAPAGTPLPFGADRVFLPLSDGTVLLPSREWFRPSFLGLAITR